MFRINDFVRQRFFMEEEDEKLFFLQCACGKKKKTDFVVTSCF